MTADKKTPGPPDAEKPEGEFMGRGKNKKPANSKPIKSAADEQIEAAMATGSMNAKKAKERKKYFKIGLTAATALFLVYGTYWAFKPFTAGPAFGVCKVFLEMGVPYPQYLRLSTVEEFTTSVRIWYTQIDSFGEYRMEQIQCYFKQDPDRGTMIEKVTINRREVDQRRVDDFNKTLSIITKDFPPDLTAPLPLPDSLQDLQINTDMLRKPLF